jgi:hypothetical protein
MNRVPFALQSEVSRSKFHVWHVICRSQDHVLVYVIFNHRLLDIGHIATNIEFDRIFKIRLGEYKYTIPELD